MPKDIFNDYKNAGAILQDAVKTLRTNIQFSSVDKPIKTIVMTSVLPHEGKSTVSAFLGISMAEIGQKTLLIESDCRRPVLQSYFGLRTKYTLMDVLRREVTPNNAVVHTSQPGLDLLGSSILANPVEILGSDRMQSMLDDFKKSYDVIILDTPPLGSFIEAAVLASKADGTVLVIESGSTQAESAKAVLAQLEKAKAHVLGVVLNNVEASGSEYYYSDYYYRDGRKKKTKRYTAQIKKTDFELNSNIAEADSSYNRKKLSGVKTSVSSSRKINNSEGGRRN